MKHESEKLIIYTDGGSRNNPGPAALGVVIQTEQGNVLKRHGETLGIATNNEAEYQAILKGLQLAKQIFGKEKLKRLGIEMRMDSKLAVEQLNGHFKVENENLQPLFMKIWNMRIELGGNISFIHVPREQNKEADRMVNQALDAEQAQLF